MDTWTPEKRSKFLETLRKNPNVTVAAHAAEMGRSGAYALKARDEEFAKLWDEAIEEGVDLLEAEVQRRAFDGVDKPITFQGRVTGSFKEYSDTLAIFLLKAHRPKKFRETIGVELDAVGELAKALAAGRQRNESLV